MNTPFYGYVYRIVNSLNGKTYIGRHTPKKDETWLAYMGSGIRVRKAIKTHGLHNFTKELISWHSSHEELCAAETSAIANEVKSGKGEYNIYLEKELPIDEHKKQNIISLYTRKFYTAEDIGVELGISKPRILEVLKTEGVLRDRNASRALRRVPETKDCLICNKTFEVTRQRGRGSTCSRSCQSSFTRKSLSVESNVLGSKRTLSNAHKASLSKAMLGNINSKATSSTSGSIGAHKRWHVARNVVKETCSFCSPL